MNCFKCGSDEHLRAACPDIAPRRRAAPAAAPASPAALEVNETPLPPPVPPRRAPEEIADYAVQAARSRALLGWSPDQAEAQRREKALMQAAESRASRLAC